MAQSLRTLSLSEEGREEHVVLAVVATPYYSPSTARGTSRAEGCVQVLGMDSGRVHRGKVPGRPGAVALSVSLACVCDWLVFRGHD